MNIRATRQRQFCTAVLLTALCWAKPVLAQTTAFSYQGKLTDAGNPANGPYDLQFRLLDALMGGNQVGAPVVREDVAVTNGIFTVTLDFGAAVFPGANRFLEIAVRPGVSTGAFTTLNPLQAITSTPYAVRSLSALAADGMSVACVNCVTSSHIGSLPANSGSYIQNTATPQAASQFNISGNGTAGGTLTGNIVNATTRYDIGGSRVLSTAGTRNVFAGVGAGQANTLGTDNAFFGYNAGLNNTGNLTIGGRFNSFFGANAGQLLTQGRSNSFFGNNAGGVSTAGSNNSFFGVNAGIGNSGDQNSFFGVSVGGSNTATDNSFFGFLAGFNNTSGAANAFFGSNAGSSNVSGSNNTVIGANANVGAGNLSNATAIGAGAVVTRSNTIILGNNANVGIGTPNTEGHKLSVVADNTFANAIAVAGSSNGNPNGIGVIGSSDGTGTGVVGVNLSSNGLAGRFDGKVSILVSLSVGSTLSVGSLGVAGGTQLCRNGAGVIAACSSSSLRYKTEVQSFNAGLGIIKRLRPITFTWKSGGLRDVGFGAEEVAEVDPLFITHNDQGQIEGVKYDRLSAVFVNAIQEQQAQIETLRAANAALQARLSAVEHALRKKAGVARRR